MNIELLIKDSAWWAEAAQLPDRHYPADAGVMLTDHLETVCRNVKELTRPAADGGPFAGLAAAVAAAGVDPAWARELLVPTALLHDIGKTRDFKTTGLDAEDYPHPLTGEPVKRRHPVLGVQAALEVLPEAWPGRDAVVALVAEHDTPYAWWRQQRRNGQVPGAQSWARLDRRIDPRGDGTGLILLVLLKHADIDGHDKIDDVAWFVEQANAQLLLSRGKWLPVPELAALRNLGAG